MGGDSGSEYGSGSDSVQGGAAAVADPGAVVLDDDVVADLTDEVQVITLHAVDLE
jgi:hypothetical protein